MNFFEYIGQNQQQIFTLLMEHIKLTAISVGFSILIGIPLGILVSYVKKLNRPILGAASVVQAIPSMALLGFAIPFLGIGTVPAVVTVIVYSLLPIIKNTFTGIDQINPQTIEAAKGIGLTKLQVLTKIQIPLALPVIMAGVRISAVTAVGLMTMAAFIGAGGLGYLVFSGIRTVNNNQILAGAIPACALALAVDFFAALVERLVTPAHAAHHKKSGAVPKLILAFAAAGIAGACVFTALTGTIKNDRVITVGTKDFSEQMILGHLAAELIEGNTDIAVRRKINLGGTQVCFSALTSDAIDLYVDYTGTAYGDTLKHPPIRDMQQVYDTVKKELDEQFDIAVLRQMRFNNTYTLAVRRDTAARYQLASISDFARVAGAMKAGTTLEFLNRPDGMPGLKRAYGFEVKGEIGLDGAPRYIALENREIDVIDAYATDGLLKKFDLVILADDRQFFPPYYAIPLVRNEILSRYPEIVPLMEQLGEVLTNPVMTELNYQVDELQLEPEVVARRFLQEQGLIPLQ